MGRAENVDNVDNVGKRRECIDRRGKGKLTLKVAWG
jgi:hypothetical protein